MGRAKRAARRPSQRRAVETVEALVEAAARILEREGLGRSFTTNRIAREAGVGIGSLYEYFDSKEALLRELSERHVARVRGAVDASFEALAEAPLEVAVGGFVDALFALHEARPALQRTLQRDTPRRYGLEPYLEMDQYVEAKVAQWLAARRPELERAAVEARAFVVVRAGRTVTIHCSAEELTAAQRAHVREATKHMLLRTLEG